MTHQQKQRVCVYCGSCHCTGEHVINESVLHEFFGDPLDFVVHIPEFGKKPHEKPNKVPYVYDVCGNCNSTLLQPYDNAAKIFGKAIKGMKAGAQIPFTEDTLGWLIKSHCNILRNRTKSTCLVNKTIYDCLRLHQPIPKGYYQPFIFIFLTDNKLFDTRWGPLPRTMIIDVKSFDSHRVMSSYFRIERLETYIYFPNDNDYLNFGERIRDVLKDIRRPEHLNLPWLDIEQALKDGSFEIGSPGDTTRITAT
jgi:hypothetical protein